MNETNRKWSCIKCEKSLQQSKFLAFTRRHIMELSNLLAKNVLKNSIEELV